MSTRIAFPLILGLVFLLIDLYAFQTIATATRSLQPLTRRIIHIAYWTITVLTVGNMMYLTQFSPTESPRALRFTLSALISIFFSAKLVMIFFTAADDIQRLVRWVASLFQKKEIVSLGGEPITRSEFISKAAVITASVPAIAATYGIISGAHDYKIRPIKVVLPNLPDAFDGYKIAQISDLHTGSFYNKRAVERGVDTILRQETDVVFFTGDMVNNTADEVLDYLKIYGKIQAKDGVYSIYGNHDYGLYANWIPEEDRHLLIHQVGKVHQELGWNLMRNEHTYLKRKDQKIGLIGVENWGTGGFPKIGDLDKARKGMEDTPVKLLLSHDPSHWDLQVRPKHEDIDITFSGHTHGMQFGIEIPGFRWSPVQYRYKQWAGLYTEGKQHLYVNRGFGFIGFPGRVGMPPEITVMELRKA